MREKKNRKTRKETMSRIRRKRKPKNSKGKGKVEKKMRERLMIIL